MNGLNLMATSMKLIAIGIVFSMIWIPPEDLQEWFVVVGLFISFSWIFENVGQLAPKLLYPIVWLVDNVTTYHPRGKTNFRRPIQFMDLCRGHRLSFLRTWDVFRVISVVMLVIFAIGTQLDGPLMALVWDWTYRVGLGVLASLVAWMVGTLIHARRHCLT